MEIKKKLSNFLEVDRLKTQRRPSWESTNEGVHEKVNFEDTLWGFSLAGGAHYDTPLRITQVKPGSRADRVGIRIGDILQSINDIDAKHLTVQEAHDIILQSGIEIKLGVAAPDVEETSYFVYQDEIVEEVEDKKQFDIFKELQGKRGFHGAKVNKIWSMIWPCNKKRDIIYRESNCYLVPSRYLQKHAH